MGAGAGTGADADAVVGVGLTQWQRQEQGQGHGQHGGSIRVGAAQGQYRGSTEQYRSSTVTGAGIGTGLRT